MLLLIFPKYWISRIIKHIILALSIFNIRVLPLSIKGGIGGLMENSKLRLQKDENGITVRIGKYNVPESIQYIQTNQIKNVEISEYY